MVEVSASAGVAYKTIAAKAIGAANVAARHECAPMIFPPAFIFFYSIKQTPVSRTRCGILHAAPQSRDRNGHGAWYGPGSAAHHAAKSGALRSVRGTNSSSQRVAVGFAGADAPGVIDRGDENLAVADLAGARGRGDDLHRLVGEVRRHRDFDPQLGQEIHDIFGAAVDFGMALLAAVTLDLRHRHAVDPDRGERLAHLVELERFDDGDDEFHEGGLRFRGFRKMGRSLICIRANLASFCANGTEKLQPGGENVWESPSRGAGSLYTSE